MNEAYQRLRDELPPRRVPDAATFSTDPKRIKTWVDALPRANAQSTLRQLGDAMESFKQVRLDAGTRLLAMEALRPAILDVLNGLDKLLVGSTFPLPPGKLLAAEQIQTFQRELATAYRVAVVELCAPSGSIPFLKSAQVSLALTRAIYHAGRDLAASYFLYRTPEAGVWSALNTLYQFAASLKLEDKTVEEPVERQALSPRQVYAQSLLFALSNPFRFTQREQSDLWPITRDLGAHVELLQQRPGEDAFGVALGEDRGPGYLPEERAREGVGMLWVGLGPLRAALEAPLQGDYNGPAQVRFKHAHTLVAPAELLRRLRAGWAHVASRGHQRLTAGHALDTVLGLSGLHYYLAGSIDFDTFLRQVRGHELGSERASWTHSGDAGRVPVMRAQVLDQSLGGYRLAWTHEESLRARVGELVGVALAGGDDERDWMVGVIRWLRYDAKGEVDAGVELLARRAQAVGLRSLDAHGAPKPPLRAIQIDSLRANAGSALHFLAPAVLDAQAPRLEVARASETDDFEVEAAPAAQCSDILVLENAGDYLLLAAHPVVHA